MELLCPHQWLETPLLIMTMILAITSILIKEKILVLKEFQPIPFVFKTELEETLLLPSQVLQVKTEDKM